MRIAVSLVAPPPLALPDQYSIIHDQPLYAGYATFSQPSLFANDDDPDGEALTAVLVQGPAHGQLELHPSGAFLYTPDSGFTGNDTFTYQASDGNLLSDPVTVDIAVTNQAPQAADDFFSVLKNYPLSNANILANDQDPGDTIHPVFLTAPDHGIVTVNSDGTINYTPDTDYLGSDSFTYLANDNLLNSDPVTVWLNIIDEHPATTDDFFTVLHDRWLLGADLLANDTLPTSNALIPIIVTQPDYGTVTVESDGTISYAPEADFVGTASFSYKLNDGVADSNVSVVTIDVSNSVPTVQAISVPTVQATTYDVLQNEPRTLESLFDLGADADGDALTVTIVQGPQNGQLTSLGNGVYQYTPNTDFLGGDSFTFTLGDGIDESSEATVWLNVTDQHSYPNMDYLTVAHDRTLTGADVLYNDFISTSSSLIPIIVDSPQHGTVSVQENGTIDYTPEPGFLGTDLITYKLNHGGIESAPAEVWITVTNSAPSAFMDYITAVKNQPLVIGRLEAFGSDPDGDTLTAVIVQGPNNGQLVLLPDGRYQYTPDTDYTGYDAITFVVNDGLENSEPTSIWLDVAEPVILANNDHLAVDEFGWLTFTADDLLANDYSTQGGTLEITGFSSPENGTLILEQDGTFNYIANLNFTGIDQFTYTVTNGTNTTTAIAFLQVGAQAQWQGLRLDSVILRNWDDWTFLSGTLTLRRLNELIETRRDIRFDDAAALATLKLFVLTEGGVDSRLGFYAAEFHVFGTVNRTQGLTLANVRRLNDLLSGRVVLEDQTRWARALNSHFVSLANRALVFRDDLFPQNATSEQLANSIKQGVIGDCSFLSALITYVRKVTPDQLRAHIRTEQVGNRTIFQVRLFDLQRNDWGSYPVTSPTPSQRLLYGGTTDGTLWLSVIEFAYLEQRIREVMPNNPAPFVPLMNGSYYEIAASGEQMIDAIRRLAGVAIGASLQIAAMNDQELARNLDQSTRRIVTVATKLDQDLPEWARARGIIGRHAYAVIGFNPLGLNGGTVTLRNPHNDPNRVGGTLVTLSLAEFRQCFLDFAAETFVQPI